MYFMLYDVYHVVHRLGEFLHIKQISSLTALHTSQHKKMHLVAFNFRDTDPNC